ncbi:MAG: hypothetical protein ABGY72_15190, partial [bacterium]
SLVGRDVQPAEERLSAELAKRRANIEQAVASGDNYRAAFAEAARFGPSVDQFFTDVLVMAEDDEVRLRRLSLLKRLERLISRLADVSELVREQD